mmetsp:Transcript_48000/g.150641  ORF Transcript_48000/g.150641 Transcript_48000/m.150641 type:complete len:104 (+) Transcript_48000:1516-1827(+)
MVLVGDAAHPLVPGTLMGGQELVEDARLLLECLSSHSIPAEIPNALVDFSRKRVPSAAYSHSLARRRLQLLCTPGLDWELSSEDEIASILETPSLPLDYRART